jgi:hypothetical protein
MNGKLRSRGPVQVAAVSFILVGFLVLSATLKAQTPTPTPTPPASKCTDHDQEKCIQVRVGPMSPQIVSDTFGKRIAQNFVAIQVTVGNHDKEYQYLINDVSLWMVASDVFTPAPPSDFFFSSAELSLLRGVSEKGQGQDKRNKILRLFRGLGTVAAGLIGVASFGPSYPAAIAVFNGPVINAYSEAFPDYTINQMNRLNDSAYSANTLVPAKHSKVMVAFIPQAIFLSKEQRKLFWDDPTSLYPDANGSCRIRQCVDFRRVSVYVDGDFITEVSNMPPIVSAVQFLDSEVQKFENEKPVVKGTVVGRFLTGTSVDFENVPEGLSVTRDGDSTADRLSFIIKSNKPVPPDTKLNFIVSNAQGTEKYTKELRYMPDPPTLRTIDPPTGKQNTSVTLTLTGTNFIPERTKILISGGGVDVSEPIEVSGTSLKVKISISEGAATGPRDLSVVNDNTQSSPKTFTITPKATNP